MDKSWRCDGCGQQVTARDAFVEWTREGDRKNTGFRIIHNSNSCSKYRDRIQCLDVPLDFFLGENGLITLLSLIDPGEHISPNQTEPDTSDWRGITQLIRRLIVPNFEEAMSKMDTADSSDWPADNNESSLYGQEELKALIQGNYDRD